MPRVSAAVTIHDQPLEPVWRVVSHGRSLAEVTEHVLSVREFAPLEGQPVTSWTVALNGSRVTWTQREVHVPSRLMTFSQIDGDFHVLSGAWRLDPLAGGVRVTLDIEFDLGVDGLAPLLDPTWSRSLQVHAEEILASVATHLRLRSAN